VKQSFNTDFTDFRAEFAESFSELRAKIGEIRILPGLLNIPGLRPDNGQTPGAIRHVPQAKKPPRGQH